MPFFVEGVNSPIPDKYANKFGVELPGRKHDATGTPVGPYLHNEGGTLNIPQTADGVFSAITLPLPGALSAIPFMQRDPSQPDVPEGWGGREAEFSSLITGITEGAVEDFGNQPTAECDDYPVGGLMKVCTILNTRGRYGVSTREVNLEKAGRLRDRLDPTALTLLNMGGPLQELFGVPKDTPSGGAVLANELANRVWESMVSFSRMLGERVWIGSPANNSGERRDMIGLDIHINENNKYDAFQQALCTSANSVVLDFNYNLVEGGALDIVEYIEEAEWQAVEWNGRRMGLWPISGIIFMRPEMWRSVARVWPIRQYWASFNEISQFTNARVMINATDAQTQRQAIRDSHLLPINGRNYLVIEDDTMPQDTPNQTASLQPGQYASDIVFVPMTVMGSVPTTFFNFFKQDNGNAETIAQIAGGFTTFTSDGGVFRWYVNFDKGCLKLSWKFEPQLKCLTPMVGWRITNVAVQPLLHQRSADPNSPYHLNGGVLTSPAGAQYYSSWNPSSPGNI